jgi:hypothetical protein
LPHAGLAESYRESTLLDEQLIQGFPRARRPNTVALGGTVDRPVSVVLRAG